jgi:hypothetical protein
MPDNSWVDKMIEGSPLNVAYGDDVVQGEQQDAIDDLDLSGTYSGDDADIQAAVNGILAVLRTYGLIADS